MHNVWLKDTLPQILDIAYEAAKAIMQVYVAGFEIETKADASPVTDADKAANAVILKRLQALPQRMPILSEEGGDTFTGPDSAGRYWLIDPLDGTKEFIKRNGEFSVNIALIEQGRPVLGVIVAPVTQLAYVAASGVGVFKIEPGGPWEPLRTTGKPSPDAVWRVMGSRSHANPQLESWLAALGPRETTRMGSSLKFGVIAEGRADVYPRLGPTSLWDTAAAQAILEQAGGCILNLDGTPLSYAMPTQTLNPSFVAWGFRP